MGDFFGGLRSGIQFPQVVMNQGPLPGAGGLPQPLHETADARINYGSSLLGDLTPYAYGEPGYLSSQNAYLNIPHKIQKIVPVVYLPEAKVGAKEVFDLSHPIDDGDIAFVMRLDRSSLFCTGLKNGDMRRAGLGTAIDPLINLCTLNYILSGLQLGVGDDPGHGNLWTELFYNLDKQWFGKPTGLNSRDYAEKPIGLDDVIHVIQHCIKPFGITRGSEKQGGQDEATISPATWPVSFVVSLTIDGKESNVVNIWHFHELHAGNDLVLRLRLMPLRPYTLNHYYKGVKRQNWDLRNRFVWQLVPDIFHIDMPKDEEVKEVERIFKTFPPAAEAREDGKAGEHPMRRVRLFRDLRGDETEKSYYHIHADSPWQELGFWHIGRSQIMTGKYGVEEYWHNDLANLLKTNHLDVTLQPTFARLPFMDKIPGAHKKSVGRIGARAKVSAVHRQERELWKPTLGLEKISSGRETHKHRRIEPSRPLAAPEAGGDQLLPVPSLAVHPPPPGIAEPVREPAAPEPVAEVAVSEEPEWLGRLEFTDSAPLEAPALGTSTAGAKKGTKSQGGKRGKTIGGSLLRADGTSEASMVGMI